MIFLVIPDGYTRINSGKMSEIRVYHTECRCQVIAPDLESSLKASLVFPYISRTRRTGISPDSLSHIHVEPGRVSLVQKPKGEGVEARSDRFTVDTDSSSVYRSRHSAEKWQIRAAAYEQVLRKHVDSYGRSRSFDMEFGVTVRAPHWIDLTVRQTGNIIALRHGDRFSHVHPESRMLGDIPVSEEFKTALQDDRGWLVMDLGKGLIAGWAAGKGFVTIQRLNPDTKLNVVELPSVNRRGIPE